MQAILRTTTHSLKSMSGGMHFTNSDVKGRHDLLPVHGHIGLSGRESRMVWKGLRGCGGKEGKGLQGFWEWGRI